VLIPLVLVAGVVGLAVGSFLNVLAYRVPRGESIVTPGSRCRACHARVKLRHNLPVVSWLALRRRCPNCHAVTSVRDPVIELLTAATFVALTIRFGAAAELPAFLYFGASAIVFALIDWDEKYLPTSVVLPSYVTAVLLLMPAGAVNADGSRTTRAFLAMGMLVLVYLALVAVSPGATGRGYISLAGLLGLYLGWLSWGALLLGAVGGLFLSALAERLSTPLTRGSRVQLSIPLGTCMAVGAVLAVFLVGPVGQEYRSITALRG
jgi:leader peptidase (prepilin peptidase)/N-methyltransferase